MKQYVNMILKISLVVFVCALCVTSVAAQESGDKDAKEAQAKNATESRGGFPAIEPKRDVVKKIGLEVSLHLLVAGNSGQQGGKLPSALDGVAKEIKQSLNVSTVGLATTLLHRVESASGLQVRGIGTSSLASPTSNPQTLPTFYDYTIGRLFWGDETGTQDIIRLNSFTFGMRFPIYLSPKAESNQQVSYETISISTSATMKENEPTIIGTTNLGRPDETLVVVMTVKRVAQR